MNLIVTANLTYGICEGRYMFKVEEGKVTLRQNNEWVELHTVEPTLLIEVWFQCANREVMNAISALGLV